MSTRAAAFAGKISNLKESISRIQNGALPQPTCTDLANMMKYFSQVLQDFKDFKDIENIPLYASEKKDQSQLIKTLPNFDYSGLYRVLFQFVDTLPLIPPTANGLDILGSNLLMLFKCLVPFLDESHMETMPYLVASLLMSMPSSLHKDILDTLCFNLLPFTIDQQRNHTVKLIGKARASSNEQQRSNGTKKRSLRRVDSGGRPAHCIVRIEDHEHPSSSIDLKSRPRDALEAASKVSDHDELHAMSSERSQFSDDTNEIEMEAQDDEEEEEEYGLMSVTSIILIAFHYINEPMYHSQLIECLMKLKSNVFEDLIFVIAYGTTRAKCPAVEILFRYWPDICPSQQDRKNNNTSSKLKHIKWQPTKCQNKNCNFSNLGDNEAVKMCIDYKMSLTMSDLPPPMLICMDCVDSIYKEHISMSKNSESAKDQDESSAMMIQSIDDYGNKLMDLLLPMERISKLCENKKCKSLDKRAVGTCFDIECANYNSKKPIRYCRDCFVNLHEPSEMNNFDITIQTHIRHSSMNLSIMEDEENINNFVEAIISLLKEAAPADRPSKDSERYLRSLISPVSQFNSDNKDSNLATEEKQLNSQYGIWLMTGLCEKVDKIKDDLLGRLLGMLFQWFHFTACLPDDQAGSALEKLKGECIKGWIMGVKNQRLDVFISCLLPHPIDCSKIGGHWEVWPDTAHQIKEGFKRLLCLVPYDIITDDVWDEIMPYWMECFRHEVPENELSELKILLSKVFDPELSPLGFETKQMYHFISSRFEDTTNTNQEQTLYWLQIITMLEIPIPIDFLFQMLKSGVMSLAVIRSNELIKLKSAMAAKASESSQATHITRESKNHGRSTLEDRSSLASSPSGHSIASEACSSSSACSDSISESSGDNVMLPSEKPHQFSDKSSETRALTIKERQAQARAAFTAKMMHHASLLNSGNSTLQQRSSESSSSIPASPSVTSAATIAAPTTTRQTTSGTGISSGLLSAAHSQPLKSTTSSMSDSQTRESCGHEDKQNSPHRHRRHHKRDHRRHEGVKGSKERPSKLQLNVESLDDGPYVNKVDNNLICYILMLDMTLKQLELQEIQSRQGLNGKEAQQAIELLNAMIATPWIGRHTCSDGFPDLSFDKKLLKGEETRTISTTHESSGSVPCDNRTSPSDSELKRKQQQDRDEAVSANIHAFSHCAQGFENDDVIETCILCEIISTFHQLALSMIEYFSPVIEISICEMSQDAANGEFDGKPDYSRIGLDHLSGSLQEVVGSSCINEHGASTASASKLGETNQFNFERHPNSDVIRQHYELFHQFQHTPLTPFSPSYLGISLKPEILSSLPSELQLTYNLLIHFHQYQTPDIVSQLLQMIKLISLNSQVLSKAAKNNPQFISWCQHNMLVGKLWSLCELESSEIARTCVPLLLHCITLPWGVRLFRDLVERDFNSGNWLQRFRAVERVVTIAHFCEPSTIKNSTLLHSTMASAFCYVVRCLDDIEAVVAQRALVSLELMKTSSLKLLLWCLEGQFDYIMADRPIILNSVFQLYNHLGDRRFLTWEFFLNRFDTIFLESQIYLQQTGEIPSFTMQDLKNTNTKSEIYQRKITRAKEALQEIHHSRSLSIRFHDRKAPSLQRSKAADSAEGKMDDMERYKQSTKLQRKFQSEICTHHSDFSDGHKDLEGNKKHLNFNVSSPSKRVLQHGKSTSSRYQTVAYLTSQSLSNRKNSKFMVNLAIQSVPASMMLPDKLHQHLPNSFVDDGSKLNEIAQENHVFGVVHRACDEDRDTSHQLAFLLMQYFSKPDPSHPTSTKNLNRVHQIVLKHLSILMGYSVARRDFLISAANLRLLPIFNAYLTSLPKVLDFNYQLGNVLLDTCLPILIYCPAPDDVSYPESSKMPTYSLWLLNPLMRQSWLMSVMTFLYKYQFGQPHLRDQVQMLMWIVINTLESNLNCRTIEMTINRYLESVNRDSGCQDDEQLGLKSSIHEMSPDTSKDQSLSIAHIDSPRVGRQKGEISEKAKTGLDEDTVENKSPTETSHRIIPSVVPSSAGKAVDISNLQNSTKTLTKADTSDNLNVKMRLFHKKTADTPSKVSHKGYKAGSMTKVNTESEPSKSVTISMNAHDERLLPIGLDKQQKSRPGNLETNQERLLPIGMAGQFPQSSRTESYTRAEFVKPNVSETSSVATQSTPASVVDRDNSTPIQSHKNLTKDVSPGQDIEPSTPSSSSGGLKSGKRRFGPTLGKISTASSGVSDVIHGGVVSKSQQILGSSKDTPTDAHNDDTPSAKSISSLKKVKGGKLATKDYLAKLSNQMVQPSFSSPSLLNEQLAQINRHSLVEEFSDKDLSMCLVILETFIHHEPSLAAQMLPNILRLVARYSSSSQESGQAGSNVHLVGGSMFVARQFVRVALHDLMENNIFHQIFTSHFTGPDFYKSMATALADFPDLNQLTPLSKLFEDLNKQKNLPAAPILKTILENVATYFECIIAESTNHPQATWTILINNWENFLRKLILALPRYGETSIPSTHAGVGPVKTDTAASIVHAGTGQGLSHQTGSAGSNVPLTNQLFGSKSASNLNDTSAGVTNGGIPASCATIMAPILRIILTTTKISHLSSCKTIMDPYSKIICYTVLNSPFKYELLLEITHNCSRIYTRDREKYLIQRTVAYELVQVIKFRFFILEENLLMLLLFMLHDVGGTLAPKVLRDSLRLDQGTLNQTESYITNVGESLRQYIGDWLEFITDVHAISRINDNLIGSQPSSINRDSFGGHVKAAISQYLALEMSSNVAADNRTVLRHLPWLYSSPSLQQGPREFIECISHIRQLSWIILGSLQHSALLKAQQNGHSSNTLNTLASGHTNQSSTNYQPIPIEKNGNVAEHVQVILAGFAEQSKESVLHMSGLFHAFLLCQLWTMYCENLCNMHPAMSEQYQFCQSTLDDFWAKITPGVLRLVGHSKVMSEMVSTHFLQLIESLIESNSSILIRYLPMWNSVFYSYKKRNKSRNLAIRLQKCIDWQPPNIDEQDTGVNNKHFLNWLEKVQYKMSHIEIQSSQAAPFYLT